jgi:multiple sugar transport system permease protein
MLKRLARQISRNGVSYLLLSPSFALLLFFFVGPVLYAFYMSLYSWPMTGVPKLIGLQNYVYLFQDVRFLQALANTLKYSAMFVLPVTVISLGVAMMLNGGIRLKNLFRSMMFVPVISSFVVASVIWTWIYHYDFGILNWLLSLIGIGKTLWLGSRNTALPAIAVMAIWKGFGYYMVLFLAGLQTIPAVYYEAAQIDGATRFQVTRYVTIPLLVPIILLVVVMATIFSFQVFDAIFVMTYGGPSWSTATLTWMIYVEAFLAYRLGYASTLGFVLFLMILVVSIIELRLIRSGTAY